MRTPIRRAPIGGIIPPKRPVRSPMQPMPWGDVGAALQELQRLYNDFQEGVELVVAAMAAFEEVKQGAPGRPGVAGRSVTQEQVEEAVRKLYVQPKDGEDGDSPSPEAVAQVLFPKLYKRFKKEFKPSETGTVPTQKELLQYFLSYIQNLGEPIWDIKDIKGLETRIAEIRNHVATKEGGMRGGGDTVVAGTNVTIENTPNGNKKINATGGVGPWQTPPETPDGMQTIFTTNGEPTDVVADGVQFFDGAGYTYSTNQITFDNPPAQYVRYR